MAKNKVQAGARQEFICFGNKPLTSEAYALLFFNGQFLNFAVGSRDAFQRDSVAVLFECLHGPPHDSFGVARQRSQDRVHVTVKQVPQPFGPRPRLTDQIGGGFSDTRPERRPAGSGRRMIRSVGWPPRGSIPLPLGGLDGARPEIVL